MTEIVNIAQAQAWNGYEGAHWAEHDGRYDAVNSGFNEPLLAAADIRDGDRVLDIGCGNGQLTRLAAARAGSGSATGLDLSGPMLARARDRARAEGIANVSFRQGDAQVHPFPAAAFDVVMSRFGIMFFADPIAAFTNIARALRPGGRLAFVAMTALGGTDLGTVFGALATHFPYAGPEDGHGPTSFSDPGRVREVLSAAGFDDIGCARVEADGIWGRDIADAAEFLLGWGPIRHQLSLVDPTVEADARRTLREALRPFDRPDGVRLRGTAWLVTASAPLL
ncbi:MULTISPECIES: class I SAM-dependent methyltransferase [Nocardia]|uniref:Methyltransferase n=1 Tax=Nocardia sputorum TaxID=2984338 RepID=A0ABM8D0E0_9NOCA|nr:class I SAM-dependent methyltransferase [Nocardia sputorum]BDU00783.1 methyltransferase [Nocardia sputorum]